MKIDLIIAILGIVICAYGVGYLIGYRHCFEFLKAELNKAMEKDVDNDTM